MSSSLKKATESVQCNTHTYHSCKVSRSRTSLAQPRKSSSPFRSSISISFHAFFCTRVNFIVRFFVYWQNTCHVDLRHAKKKEVFKFMYNTHQSDVKFITETSKLFFVNGKWWKLINSANSVIGNIIDFFLDIQNDETNFCKRFLVAVNWWQSFRADYTWAEINRTIIKWPREFLV